MLQLQPYTPTEHVQTTVYSKPPDTLDLIAMILTLSQQQEEKFPFDLSESTKLRCKSSQYNILKQLSINQLINFLVVVDTSIRQLFIRILNEFTCIELCDHEPTTFNQLCVSSNEFQLLCHFIDSEPLSQGLHFKLIYLNTDDIIRVERLLKYNCLNIKINNRKLESLKKYTAILNKINVLLVETNSNIDLIGRLDQFNELEIVGNGMDNQFLKVLLFRFADKFTKVTYIDRNVDFIIVPDPNSDEKNSLIFDKPVYDVDTSFELNLSSQIKIEALEHVGFEKFKALNFNLVQSNTLGVEFNQLFENLKNLRKLSVNAILNPEKYLVSFDSENLALKDLSFSGCELGNCLLDKLANLETLLLLECKFKTSNLASIKNLKNLKKIIIINCELDWDSIVEIPSSVQVLKIANNDTTNCKNLCFGSFGDETECLTNRNTLLEINSMKYNLRTSVFSNLFMFKTKPDQKVELPTDFKSLEFLIVPNLDPVDFQSINLKDMKSTNPIQFKLYSFSNTFYKPKSLPQEPFKYDFQYINLNHLNSSDDGYDEDDDELFENSMAVSSHSEDVSDFEETVSMKQSTGSFKGSGRDAQRQTTDSIENSQVELTDDESGLDDDFDSEDERDLDTSGEEKRKSNLIRNVISSKNIRPSDNPRDPDKPFECEYCYKAFKRKEHLRRHSLTHTNYRPHICTKCGRGFRRSDNLKNHQRRCFNSGKADGTGYRLKIDPSRLDAKEIERVKKMEIERKNNWRKLKEAGKPIKLSEYELHLDVRNDQALDSHINVFSVKDEKPLKSQTPSLSQSQSQTESQTQIPSESQPEPQPESQPEPQPEPQPESQPRSQPESRSQSIAQHDSHSGSQPQVQLHSLPQLKLHKYIEPRGQPPFVPKDPADHPSRYSTAISTAGTMGILKMKKKSIFAAMDSKMLDSKARAQAESSESQPSDKNFVVGRFRLNPPSTSAQQKSEEEPRTKSGRAVKLPDKFREVGDDESAKRKAKQPNGEVDDHEDGESDDLEGHVTGIDAEDANEDDYDEAEDNDDVIFSNIDDEEEGKEDSSEIMDEKDDPSDKGSRAKAIRSQVNLEFSKCEILPDGSFRCSQCQKIFTKRGNLKRHLIIHFNLKPYACDCGKSFKRSDNYQKHTSCCKKLESWKRHKRTRMMHKEKPEQQNKRVRVSNPDPTPSSVPAPVFAPAPAPAPAPVSTVQQVPISTSTVPTFSASPTQTLSPLPSSISLKREPIEMKNEDDYTIVIDPEEKRIAAAKANAQFAIGGIEPLASGTQSQLGTPPVVSIGENTPLKFVRKSRHPDERSFACDRCTRTFKRKYHLQRHELVHMNLNDKPFTCGTCGATFKRDDLLEKHLSTNKCM